MTMLQYMNIHEKSSITCISISDNSIYQLPYKYNQRKPPNGYSHDEAKRSKYPIANHVSSSELSEPCKAFIQQLSADNVLGSMKEALSDTGCTKSMKEEMSTLSKKKKNCGI